MTSVAPPTDQEALNRRATVLIAEYEQYKTQVARTTAVIGALANTTDDDDDDDDDDGTAGVLVRAR